MEVTGELKDVQRDWNVDEFIISFAINERITQEMIEEIQEGKLSIKAVKYRAKRSLNANAYFHVLVGKLADVLRISKPRCKNILLHRYGQPELLDDGSQAVVKSNVPASKMLEVEEMHFFPCGSKKENGMTLTFYKISRGSHTYDTREMSVLIDGTVEECKDMGIETLPPEKIEHLKSMWKGGAK